LRRRRQIIAHVQMIHRTMRFGGPWLPVAGLDRLGVAPEYRGQGLGMHLLRAAEHQMEAGGAMVGMLQTSKPGFFEHTGWTPCGQASYRRAGARAILARLRECGLLPYPRRRLHIRPWLKWEYAALARIYCQNVMPGEDASGLVAVGPLERTEAYWNWLLKRHAFDRVYVALEGPELLELGETTTHMVGYAVTRGDQILELMTAADRPRVAARLLARCCGDAIEQDMHSLLLHAPAACPLLTIFDEAGGRGPPQAPDRDEVSMVRLLAPLQFLRRLCGEFHRRAEEANLSRPLDLGLLVEGRKYQLELRREGAAVVAQRLGRSYLRLNVADFTRLVLGQLDWNAAIDQGRLECSTALAHEAGRVIFPRQTLWRPPWDNRPAA